MFSPALAFHLSAFFGGLGQSESTRGHAPGIGERPVVEKLNLHSPFVVSHARVRLLMELPQTPDA